MATNKHPKGQKGLYIEVRNGNIEQALRKLKRKVNNEGIIQEVRERQAFVPNFEIKKRRMAAAKSRLRKQQAKNNW